LCGKYKVFNENIGNSKGKRSAEDHHAVKISENVRILHNFFKKIFEIFLA